MTNNNNSGSKYQYQSWPRKSTTARGEDGEEVVEDEELENDEEEIDNTIDEREEEEYFYETNRIRKFNGGEIVISATSSSPLPSSTSSSSVSTNSTSTYPITANDTNTTSSLTSTTTKRIVSQTSYKVLGEASRSSGTYRKTLAKETGNKNKLLTTFAEPLFALHHPSSLGALVSDYVFKIRILTEDNIQLSEFELNVSCKRMSSTSAIDNGINGNFITLKTSYSCITIQFDSKT